MSLESPRDLHFEGANAPEHRPPRASHGSRISHFFLPGDFAFSLQQLLSFSRDPAGVPIRQSQEGLFSEGAPFSRAAIFPAGAKGRPRVDFPTETRHHVSQWYHFSRGTRVSVKVQGDPHSANFVNQNSQTALQTSR